MICFKPKTENINIESNLDIKLYYCGTGDCEESLSWGPGIKDHYKLHYIFEGSGIFKIGEKEYLVKKGDGFLICPNVLCSYKPDSNSTWDYCWIAFNGLSAESYLNRANLTSDNPVFTCSEEDFIKESFNTLFNTINCTRSMDLRSLSIFYSILAVIIDDSQQLHDNFETHQGLYIKQAIEFISTNYSRKISIEEMANYVGISRKYLSTLFSKNLNQSPQNFLIHFRLNKACDLLANSTLSISEISNSIGYSDPLLFSKVFRKFKAVSPKSYRENFKHSY